MPHPLSLVQGRYRCPDPHNAPNLHKTTEYSICGGILLSNQKKKTGEDGGETHPGR